MNSLKDRSKGGQVTAIISRNKAIQDYYKHPKRCKFCKNIIEVGEEQVTQIKRKNFCNRSCAASFINKTREKKDNTYLRYKANCSFNFNLSDYPEEFDISLIRKHGMFSSIKNRNGISRDHKISINFGFKNNIEPEIIKHPANCELMRQDKNIKKFTKCSTTLEELLDKIKEWDKKYS